MMSLLVNGTAPFTLLIAHASDEHKSCLSYMTLLGKNISEKICTTLLQKICASRESNPGHKHGRLVCYRYTTGALASQWLAQDAA